MKPCFICNNQLKVLRKSFGRTILKCESCGLGATKNAAKLNYSQYHRDEVYRQSENQFRNIFKKIVQSVLRYKRSGKVLDIGSSTGTLLALFKDKGWEVQGIEPSREAREYAIKSGIPTINSTFERANLEPSGYDVAIMDHVLEHTKSPDLVLKKVNEVLKEKGVLVINVPNFGSLSAKLYGANWEYILPEEHLWHFTPRALNMLLDKNDFEVLEWRAQSGIWEYEKPFLELWQSLIGGKKRFFRNMFTAIPSWFITQLKMGTGLSVIAIKK